MSPVTHMPAGTPKGGQFASAKGGASFGKPVTAVVSNKAVWTDQGATHPKVEITDAEVGAFTKEMGKEMSKESLAAVAGLDETYTVNEMTIRGTEGVVSISASVSGDKVHIVREIDLKNNRIINSNMYIEKDSRGQGIGTKMLVDQVRSASDQGFDSIHLRAAGSGPGERSWGEQHGTVGYYTWARLGFVPDRAPNVYAGAGKRVSVNTTRAMATSQGRAWWKKNGGAFDGTFDLKKGSTSRRVLDAYAKEKGL